MRKQMNAYIYVGERVYEINVNGPLGIDFVLLLSYRILPIKIDY